MMDTLDQCHDAYDKNFPLDNRLTLEWYPQRVKQHCSGVSLLELGLGHGYSTAFFADAFPRYVVIEGSAEMIKRFRRNYPQVHVDLVEGFFEDFSTDEKFDVINMGFVLEHVEDPDLILRRYRKFLSPGGSIFVAVPNCEALHRRFGHAAGLLPDMTTLSPADLEFGHRRYFSLASLSALVTGAGYRIVKSEGLFLKPLTTGQLSALELPESVFQAMMAVGVDYPELANSILMQIEPAP